VPGVVDGGIDYGAAYATLRERVVGLVRRARGEQLEARAPATPEWRVRDVLAHLTGVTADILSGNLDGVATDAWTEAQVAARRDLPVDALLAEWEENGPVIDPMIPSFGPVAGQFLTDAITHEQDIRGALCEPGARDSDAMAISFEWIGEIVGAMRDEAGAGALQIDTATAAYVFGSGEPTRCATTRFEFVRATTGRRSIGQIEGWGWQGEPRVEPLVLPIFTARRDALVE
jgi:Mycothiol maleylpyruvate isomerase N-terminal domain